MQVASSLNTLNERFCRQYEGFDFEYKPPIDSHGPALVKLWLPETLRCRGIGTKFMEEVVAILDAEKSNCVLVASDRYGSDLERLVEFYSRFGFVKTGVPVRPIGDEEIEYMERVLS